MSKNPTPADPAKTTAEPGAKPEAEESYSNPIIPFLWILIPLALTLLYGLFSPG